MATSSSAASAPWHASLYWRLAGTFVLLFVITLGAHALLLLLAFERVHTMVRPRIEAYLAEVAIDLSRAIESDPRLDLQDYLRQQHAQPTYPLVVAMADGRSASTESMPLPIIRQALEERLKGLLTTETTGSVVELRGPGPARRPVEPPAVVVRSNGALGLVSTSPRALLGAVNQFAIVSGIALAIFSSSVAAFVLFRPLRVRVGSLAAAAAHLGAGNLNARASEQGNDEIAVLARTFNRMASDLQTRAIELRAAEHSRRALLADVSHELRTPLTTMLGHLDAICSSSDRPDAATTEGYIAIVRQEAHRLRRLVDDLFDLSRLETANPQPLAIEDVMVEQLFGETIASCELDARAAGVALTSRIAPGAEIVSGDPLRLGQAVKNLVDNSIRHTPAGGRIELGADISHWEFRLSVRDTGVGIPPEYHAVIFERFQTVSGAVRNTSGTGLGLSIVKAIAARHGGSVTVTSDVGDGSTFTIILPEG